MSSVGLSWDRRPPLDFQRQFEAVRGRNAVLSCLVAAAQAAGSPSDCELNLMLLALWRGLDAVHRRVRARRLLVDDELATEVPAKVIEMIRTLSRARVGWIAATVLKNIERDMMRNIQCGVS